MLGATLGPIPKLTAQAARLLDDYTVRHPASLDNPLILGARTAAQRDVENDQKLSSLADQFDGFAMTVAIPFYRAVRAGEVARGLEQCGIAEQLQARLRSEMRRVFDEIFERGNLKPVPIHKAVRAITDTGLITLDHALATRGAGS